MPAHARPLRFVRGPLLPLTEGSVRVLFRQYQTTHITQLPLAGAFTLLWRFLGHQSFREPVLGETNTRTACSQCRPVPRKFALPRGTNACWGT